MTIINKSKTETRGKKKVKTEKKEKTSLRNTLSPHKKRNEKKKTLKSVIKKTELRNSDVLRKRQIEQQKIDNVERYQIILENINDGCFEVDLAGNFTYFNDSVCRALGYPRKELMGMNIRHYATDEETAEKVFQASNSVYKTGKPLKSLAWQITRKDGAKRYVEASLSLLKDSSGKPTGFLGITNDVTERKRAEESLLLIKKAVESSSDAIGLSDPEGNHFYHNKAFSELFGYTPKELSAIGGGPSVYVNKDVAKSVFDTIMKGDSWNGEILMVSKSGRAFPVILRADAIKDDDGKIIGLIGLHTDITERKRAEERYRSIFENAQEGIYQSTPEGKFVVANQSMARILGYESPEDLITSLTDIPHQLYVDPNERTKIFELINLNGFARNREVRFYRKDGRIIWVSRTMQAVRDEKGQVLYYEGIIEDITERKESIERLRNALGGTVRALASVVETRDPYTAGHQRQVGNLARAIAKEMGLSIDRIEGLRMAAIIHDIGKVSIPTEILTKPSKLNNLEFDLIKTHTQAGYDILKDIDFPWPVAMIVLEHHERMDGSGYPRKIKGENILLEARILAVADVVEAISSHRPYRPALGIDIALDEISQNRGILYDATVVDTCLKLFKKKKFTLS